LSSYPSPVFLLLATFVAIIPPHHPEIAYHHCLLLDALAHVAADTDLEDGVAVAALAFDWRTANAQHLDFQDLHLLIWHADLKGPQD